MIDAAKIMTIVVALIILGVGVFAFFITTTGIDNSGYDYNVDKAYTFDAEKKVTAGDWVSVQEDWNTDFNTTRNTSIGTSAHADFVVSAGYLETFNRSYLYFDTSSLPDTATVKYVTLQITANDASGDSEIVVAGNHTGVVPSFPTVTADFNISNYTSIYANNFTTLPLCLNEIPFTNITCVNLTGNTKMALFISDDYWAVNGSKDLMGFDTPDEVLTNPKLIVTVSSASNTMTDVPSIGSNVFNIVGVFLLLAGIMSIVGLIYTYVK